MSVGQDYSWDIGIPPEMRYELYSDPLKRYRTFTEDGSEIKEEIYHKAILCSGGLGRKNCMNRATHLVPTSAGAIPVCSNHQWGSGRCKLDEPIIVHWEAATGREVDEDGQRHEEIYDDLDDGYDYDDDYYDEYDDEYDDDES